MKRLFSILFCAFAGAVLLCAQDRTELEDSVIVGSIPQSVLDMSLESQQLSDDEKLATHWAYTELMKEETRKYLAEFTDQELREILAFQRTPACRCVSSAMFLKAFAANLVKAVMCEAGAASGFSYSLNDRSYGQEGRPYYEALLSSVTVLDELKEKNTDPKALKVVDKVVGEAYDIFLYTAVDYISKDELKDMFVFVASPLGQKYYLILEKAGKGVEMAMSDYDSWVEARVSDESAFRTSVSEYVSLSRSFEEYIPELYRPYAEMPLGKGMYAGQTRDLKPHGKGVLTDKKGVTYSGNFKDGKRHGVIEVTVPGKEPQVQYWADDRHQKKIPVAEGSGIEMQYIDGKPAGYVDMYDASSGRRLKGVFVDGALEGPGTIIEFSRTISGEFRNGELVNGNIVWDDEKYSLREFRGKMAGSLGYGLLNKVHKDEPFMEQYVGSLKDGRPDGKGTRRVRVNGHNVEYSGSFAYGKMFGRGTQRRMIHDEENGIRESDVYEGQFFADMIHGHGKMTISLSDIPEGSWSFVRNNVKLPSVKSQSMVIVMEGTFDEGSFIEGRVTYSDGSWYEGTFTRSGLVDGKMRRVYKDGSYEECGIRDGQHYGNAVIRYADGTVSEGVFENGVFKEDGAETHVDEPDFPDVEERVYRYEDLPVEKGKVRLVKAAGVNIMVRGVSSIEIVCEGSFKDDVLENGKVTMSDGNWMEGTFEDGVLITGRGRSVDRYGTIYEGDIRNGFPHGNGKCTYSDGTWFKGKFANGNRMGGTHYAADGKVIKVYE